MGQAEDAIDAVHGSLAHVRGFAAEWRQEFSTDLAVMRAKLDAIAGALTAPDRSAAAGSATGAGC
jgi:hypothetical protein